MKNNFSRRPVWLLPLLLCFFWSACAAHGAEKIQDREARVTWSNAGVPNFSLKDVEGKDVRLSDFHGKVVMLKFFATWCPSCIEEGRNLQIVYDSEKDAGLEIVAIGVDDSVEELRKFRDECHITYPILIDQNGLLKDAFHLDGIPVLQFLNREGQVTTVEDPKSGSITERIIGIREWTSAAGLRSIRRLLK